MPEDILNGDEVARQGDFNLRQTWLNTHNGSGDRLNPWQNSFISFSYGGKYIEDFGLNVVNLSDRRTFTPYASFNDITTTYDVLDGALYWGTHFGDYRFTLDLATDGMTEEQLRAFQLWFEPGVIRTFKFSEHWNRELNVRVGSVPDIQMIPFEDNLEKTFGGQTFTIKTTLYKGEISINLISDEPFWHSVHTYFNSNTLSLDEQKIVYEDNTPWLPMFSPSAMTINLDNTFVIGQPHTNYLEWKESSENLSTEVVNIDSESGDITLSLQDNLTLDLDHPLNLYYAGSAPSAPKISFNIAPVILGTSENDNSNLGDIYLAFPCNSYVSHDFPYNIIQIGDSKLKFTAPSLWYGYNEAIEIINAMVKDGVNIEQIRQAFTERIHNRYARAWAIACLCWMYANNPSGDNAWLDENNNFIGGKGAVGEFRRQMMLFLVETLPAQAADKSTGFISKFNYNFNTGIFSAVMSCRVCSVVTISYSGDGWDAAVAQLAGTTNMADVTISEIKTNIQENVGDMICSGHLLIKEHNECNNEGYITPDECQKIQLFDEYLGIIAPSLVILNHFNIDYVYKYY